VQTEKDKVATQVVLKVETYEGLRQLQGMPEIYKKKYAQVDLSESVHMFKISFIDA
jgi:hypothetical protein